MGKMLFGLISACCLSGFLIAHPGSYELTRSAAMTKEVMAICAVQHLRKYPESPLTINILTANKPKLARQFSDVALNMMNLNLGRHEEELVRILVDSVELIDGCPVPPTPPKASKRRKTLGLVGISMPIYSDNLEDCKVPGTPPPPPSPKNNRSLAEKQVDRLHRQWATKWNSDGDLQTLVRNDDNSYMVTRKRTSSH